MPFAILGGLLVLIGLSLSCDVSDHLHLLGCYKIYDIGFSFLFFWIFTKYLVYLRYIYIFCQFVF